MKPLGGPVRELTSLELAQPDAGSYFGEVFAQRVALFDFALKALRMQMQP